MNLLGAISKRIKLMKLSQSECPGNVPGPQQCVQSLKETARMSWKYGRMTSANRDTHSYPHTLWLCGYINKMHFFKMI